VPVGLREMPSVLVCQSPILLGFAVHRPALRRYRRYKTIQRIQKMKSARNRRHLSVPTD